jgi:hypothetical protein
MKKIIIILILFSFTYCSDDNKLKEKPKTEQQSLEAERDSALKKIDSIKNVLKNLQIERDSIKSISTDTLQVN